jgi:very-short-patch-repair endonuclease
MNKNNKRLTPNAQKMRKEMTPEEKHLWFDFLKKQPFTVNRQKVILKYIADFYIAKYRIIIEVDGSQHYEESNAKYDKARDDFFKSQGILVLRYTNTEINTKFEGVCLDILKVIKERDTSSPATAGASPRGEAQRGTISLNKK